MSTSNSSTAGQVVFVVSLLGIFFILVMAMPSEFYLTAPSYDQADVPDYWSAEDIRDTVYWGAINLTYDLNWHTITIGSGTLDETVRARWYDYPGATLFHFQHFWYQWGWYLVAGNVEPYPLNEEVVRENIDSSGNGSRIEMTCDHHNYIVYFNNNGSYADLEAALDAKEVIIVSMGVGWSTEQGVLSGWDLVVRLLSFQLPDITTEVNAIIALPLWTLIGFLVFVTITMIVDMLPLT